MKNELKKLLGQPLSAAEIFHQKTKFKKWSPFPDAKDWPKEWKTTFFKEYPRLDKIMLPDPQTFENVSLETVLQKRKSSRIFSKTPLSLEQISTLLYASAGLRDTTPPWKGNRTYPSAGARYPLEVYLISQNSELPIGIYHYNLRSHCLEVLLQMKKFNNLFYFHQPWTEKASVLVLLTALFERNTMKYGIRGYRHILAETGHIGQNMYLVAAALDISACAIGGYLDDPLNTLLDIDSIKESVISVIGVGNT